MSNGRNFGTLTGEPYLFGIPGTGVLLHSHPMFFFTKKKNPEPVVLSRSEHNISRQNIAPEALNVLYRLSDSGFVSYLVGGSVRDMLLGRKPKDFDVATDAQPRQIKKLFRNAHLIGRRFRLALICFKDRQIETSTFRREPDPTEAEDDGRPGALYRDEDNLFGTPEQDAQRRDFTVNGLFYDIKTFAVIDYVGGLEDLRRKILRSIGDPNVRFREDPVRMMRAVRFATKLGFDIHRDSEKAILRHHAEIVNASPPRLFEEVTRLFGAGAAKAFSLLSELRLMGDLLPAVQGYIKSSGGSRSPLWPLLSALDAHADLPSAEDPALRFAALLYPIYFDRVRALRKDGVEPDAETVAADLVGNALVNPFVARTWCPPRGLCEDIAHILAMQTRFDSRPASSPRRGRLVCRDWFSSALLLYRLRTEASQGDLSDVEAWEAFAKSTVAPVRVQSSDDVFLAGRLPRNPAEKQRMEQQRRRGPKPSSQPGSPEASDTPEGPESDASQDRPRRRRRRGGRRHRGRRDDGAASPSETSTPAP